MFTATSNHFLEADLIQTKNVRRIVPVPVTNSLVDFEPAINFSLLGYYWANTDLNKTAWSAQQSLADRDQSLDSDTRF